MINYVDVKHHVPRKRPSPDPVSREFLVGTTVWTVPRYGQYDLILRGAGGKGHLAASGAGARGGGSGAFVRRRQWLRKGQTVTVVIKAAAVGAGQACTMTLPDGRVLSAGCGGNGTASVSGTAGVASGGDTNLNGSAGGINATTPTGDGAAGLGVGGGAGGLGHGSQAWGGGAGAPGDADYPGQPGAGSLQSGVHVSTCAGGAGDFTSTSGDYIGGLGWGFIRSVD